MRGQLGGICQLKVTWTVLKNPVVFFSLFLFLALNSRQQDYRVGYPPPTPCLCPLSPQSGSLVHFSSMIGPSWHHRAEVLNVVTFPRASKHQFPQPSTTVVLDQIQTRSVSIFVKDYYAWVNEASCSHRRLLLLRTKVSSTPLLFCSVVTS